MAAVPSIAVRGEQVVSARYNTRRTCTPTCTPAHNTRAHVRTLRRAKQSRKYIRIHSYLREKNHSHGPPRAHTHTHTVDPLPAHLSLFVARFNLLAMTYDFRWYYRTRFGTDVGKGGEGGRPRMQMGNANRRERQMTYSSRVFSLLSFVSALCSALSSREFSSWCVKLERNLNIYRTNKSLVMRWGKNTTV